VSGTRTSVSGEREVHAVEQVATSSSRDFS
jgi:hypothetical protein